MSMLTEHSNLRPSFSWLSRKQEAPRGSRDEKRRAQHNEGRHVRSLRGLDGEKAAECLDLCSDSRAPAQR